MQSEGTLDLFFFQGYKWFCNKNSAQAFGPNGYLLTSVNEWPVREHERGRDEESSSGSSEKQGLRWNMLFSPLTHTHTHNSLRAISQCKVFPSLFSETFSLIYTANALSSVCVCACWSGLLLECVVVWQRWLMEMCWVGAMRKCSCWTKRSHQWLYIHVCVYGSLFLHSSSLPSSLRW